jgi:nucleotide-binding universal stress UspA family protein
MRALLWAAAVVEPEGGTLVCVTAESHYLVPDAIGAMFGGFVLPTASEPTLSVAADAISTLASGRRCLVTKSLPSTVFLNFPGHLVEGLVVTASERRADLVVVGTQPRRFRGVGRPISSRLAHRLRCPLVVVP